MNHYLELQQGDQAITLNFGDNQGHRGAVIAGMGKVKDQAVVLAWDDVADNNEALKQAEKVKRSILLARETGRWHLTEVALEQLDKLLQAIGEGK